MSEAEQSRESFGQTLPVRFPFAFIRAIRGQSRECCLATESQLAYFLQPVNETKNKPARSDGFFPLSDVQAGSSVRIKQVSASPEITSRLREMGFCEEQKIRLISRHTHVVCQVCHARLGISTKLAEKIMVEPLTGQKAA